LTEELCIQFVLPTLGSDDALHQVLKYSEVDGGMVNMEVTHPGANRNPPAEGDPISMALTWNAREALSWQCRNGACRIEVKADAPQGSRG